MGPLAPITVPVTPAAAVRLHLKVVMLQERPLLLNTRRSLVLCVWLLVVMLFSIVATATTITTTTASTVPASSLSETLASVIASTATSLALVAVISSATLTVPVGTSGVVVQTGIQSTLSPLVVAVCMNRALVVIINTTLLIVLAVSTAITAAIAATAVFLTASSETWCVIIVSAAFLGFMFLVIIAELHVVHVLHDTGNPIHFQVEPVGMVCLMPQIWKGVKHVLSDLCVVQFSLVSSEAVGKPAECFDPVNVVSTRSTSGFRAVLVVAYVLNKHVTRGWMSREVVHELLAFGLEPICVALVGCNGTDLVFPLCESDAVKDVFELGPLVANSKAYPGGRLVKLVKHIEEHFDTISQFEDWHVSLLGSSLSGVAFQAGLPHGQQVQC